MTPEEWEGICDRCGGCCQVAPGIACPGLGPDNLCTVYEKRLETYPCINVTPQNVKFLHEEGILPDSCSYVSYMKGEEPEPKEYKLIPFSLASEKHQRIYKKNKAEWFGRNK